MLRVAVLLFRSFPPVAVYVVTLRYDPLEFSSFSSQSGSGRVDLLFARAPRALPAPLALALRAAELNDPSLCGTTRGTRWTRSGTRGLGCRRG